MENREQWQYYDAIILVTPKDNVNFLRAAAFICSKLIIETLIETIEIIDNIIYCVKSTQSAQ